MLAQELDLNVFPKGMRPSVHVSQYDNQNNGLIVYLYNDDVPWAPPSGSGAIINGIKPDHTAFSYAASSLSSNKVTLNITNQMTAIAGSVICELRISRGREVIGTLNFDLVVEPAPLRDDSVISESYLPLVSQAVEVATKISQYINTAQTAAETATNAAQTAAQDVRDDLSTDITRALNAAQRAEIAEANSAIYNGNIISNYEALEAAKQNANAAASNAQTIADTLTTAYNTGVFKGDKGDKGDTGESGITASSVGLFTLSVDSDGNLYAWSNDQYDPAIADGFNYDTDTGNLYYDFEYEEPTPAEPDPDPNEPDPGNTTEP